MKLLKNVACLSLLLVFAFSSCIKEPAPDVITEIEEVLITSSLNGSVVDETGIPITDAMVNLGSNTRFTDENGSFSFSDVEMDQNGTVITVDKEGYFSNTKVLLTKTNQTATTKVMLIARTITNTFDATIGGISTTNGGAKVDFGANTVALQSGGTYSGNVNVYATWLDPTADDLPLRMPGDLRGSNTEEEAVTLVTYGMIGVELEGDNGEALNIAEGETATIEIPVPAELLNSAPATIPLWHFDEDSGYWIEEGEATLTSDNTYVGTVSHFSFWNYDVPYGLIHIEGTVLDFRGEKLSGLSVVISLENGDAGYGWTNSEGLYEGYVPKDQALKIEIFDSCGESIYTGDIGPFEEDSTVSDIIVVPTEGSFLTVSGVLNNCNNEPESNGYVSVATEEWGFPFNFIEVNNDGSFNGTVDVCGDLEVFIYGVSNDPFSQGTTTSHDVTGLTELNVGTLISCW